MPVWETYERVGDGYGTSARPFNYFHINSIALDANGDLLISGRNTWAVYKVSRKNGSIVWRIGGKKSDFSMGPGSRFFWQHHVRAHGHGKFTVFDNGRPDREKHSRALILRVDTAAMHVTLRKAYVHPGTAVLAATMGTEGEQGDEDKVEDAAGRGAQPGRAGCRPRRPGPGAAAAGPRSASATDRAAAPSRSFRPGAARSRLPSSR